MTERLHFHFSLLCIGEGNGNPLQCSCLENRRDGGAWWAAIYEFPRETGLTLRAAGKAGNPFQTTQGNRLSCRDQEGRRGSEEAVPGPSVFPSGDPGVSDRVQF